ncbi:GL10999 [Drosophila persimilis]|uniref:Larval cuticle protein 4-like n=2 Tax=pseudoobscura subgroup TaxID=32358 RepID=A0A6I8V3U1_DROPS|nr:larval cuticle protein 4 [Drosophila persimilis]XP_002138156.1 larval cuticle protein 4 [Drosophila pseudoobscura]EDW31377.1 GL10999 [Drosophila persimilis]
MFKYLAFILLVAACTATDDDAHAHVEKQYKKEDGHGKFSYGYDITNGIGAGEAGDEHQVHGEYHFTSKEGLPVKVSYTADENGYHPHGDLLPTPPPTPEAILRALAYIDAHPHKEEPRPAHPHSQPRLVHSQPAHPHPTNPHGPRHH